MKCEWCWYYYLFSDWLVWLVYLEGMRYFWICGSNLSLIMHGVLHDVDIPGVAARIGFGYSLVVLVLAFDILYDTFVHVTAVVWYGI